MKHLITTARNYVPDSDKWKLLTELADALESVLSENEKLRERLGRAESLVNAAESVLGNDPNGIYLLDRAHHAWRSSGGVKP